MANLLPAILAAGSAAGLRLVFSPDSHSRAGHALHQATVDLLQLE
jgi:hypothetical protein